MYFTHARQFYVILALLYRCASLSPWLSSSNLTHSESPEGLLAYWILSLPLLPPRDLHQYYSSRWLQTSLRFFHPSRCHHPSNGHSQRHQRIVWVQRPPSTEWRYSVTPSISSLRHTGCRDCLSHRRVRAPRIHAPNDDSYT